MEDIKNQRTTIRLQRVHKAASALKLEYFYRDNGLFICKDASMNNITEDEFKKGKTYKTIVLNEREFYKDVEVDISEKAFLSRHPFIKFEGNPNMNNCTLEMIDVQEKTNKDVVELKKKNEVFNIVNSLDIQEINNLCHYLGLNIVGKDMNDIFLLLLGNEEGVAYLNYDKVKLYSKDSDAIMKVTLNKAIVLGIVEKRNDGFYFGNKIVAASIDELYYFCKNNTDLYETGISKVVDEQDHKLLPNVLHKENFVAANEEYMRRVEAKQFATTYTELDREWGIAKLKELSVKGYYAGNVKTETIIQKALEYPQLKLEWAARKSAEKKQPA